MKDLNEFNPPKVSLSGGDVVSYRPFILSEADILSWAKGMGIDTTKPFVFGSWGDTYIPRPAGGEPDASGYTGGTAK